MVRHPSGKVRHDVMGCHPRVRGLDLFIAVDLFGDMPKFNYYAFYPIKMSEN